MSKKKNDLTDKYRPKKLSEVIGQPSVVKAFTNAFKYKTIRQAYILAGNFGTGKTTVARIVAAMENCEEKGSSSDPCGKCRNCEQIFSGDSYDVKEMDAASKRGIDDIRSIHKELYQSPIECKTKYVIFDEAHSLSGYAAEAALKMIEEPPPHTRFILATTDFHKLKETIRSRCIPWRFGKVNWMEILTHLKDISTKEELNVEENALRLIARSSKGSVRDSLKNLQAAIDYCGEEEITLENAKNALGTIDDALYFELINSFIELDAIKSYRIINEILKDGREAKSVMNDLFDYLTNLLLVKACKKDLACLTLSEEEVKKYSHQGKVIKGDTLIRMMNFLHEVGDGLNKNVDPVNLFNKFFVQSLMLNKKNKNGEN